MTFIAGFSLKNVQQIKISLIEISYFLIRVYCVGISKSRI